MVLRVAQIAPGVAQIVVEVAQIALNVAQIGYGGGRFWRFSCLNPRWCIYAEIEARDDQRALFV